MAFSTWCKSCHFGSYKMLQFFCIKPACSQMNLCISLVHYEFTESVYFSNARNCKTFITGNILTYCIITNIILVYTILYQYSTVQVWKQLQQLSSHKLTYLSVFPGIAVHQWSSTSGQVQSQWTGQRHSPLVPNQNGAGTKSSAREAVWGIQTSPRIRNWRRWTYSQSTRVGLLETQKLALNFVEDALCVLHYLFHGWWRQTLYAI